MAEDVDQEQKTEEPSGKRLDEARERGQLPISREMATFVCLLSSLIVVAKIAPGMSEQLVGSLRMFFEHVHEIELGGPNMQTAMMHLMLSVGLATVLIFSVLAAAAILGTMLQTGFFMSTDMIKIDLERLKPWSGLSKLFSYNSVIELGKSFVKLVVLGWLAYMMISPLIRQLPSFVGRDLLVAVAFVHQEIIHILSVLMVVVGALAIADFIYQRLHYMKSLRMTKTEVKDEFKQTEGDPKIKSRLRQIRLEKARKRMIARVPKADVVVTNPTHYAVALEYNNQKMKAPIVSAKGADRIAQRIREVALENNVPIVSNPPLARALYDTVDIDFPIKAEHYKAVAEVISFVYKLKKKRL